MPWLTTDRLAIRRFTPDDLDWFASFYADPTVARFLGGVRTRADAERLFQERILDYYEAYPGFGTWMTTDLESGEPLGFHVLNYIAGETIVQVGYGLLSSAWGRGMATEGALAMLQFGFREHGLRQIAGMTSLDNRASLRVLEKSGLERRGERAFPHPMYAKAGSMAWFEREAEAWLAEFGGVERYTLLARNGTP
jgi:RimJ/RimL family protein N-acetyltransferase